MNAVAGLEPNELFAPTPNTDVLVRKYEDDSIVWASGGIPIRLDPVGSLIFELLDGEVTVGELADDVHAVVGVPRTVALDQIRSVISALDVGGALVTSNRGSLTPPTTEVFFGPPNP